MGGAPWEDWVGRTQHATDIAAPTPARALAASLDRPDVAALEHGAELPHLWSWLYFLPLAPASEMGPDGHPRRGGFLPPVELPRRMWAGSRCRFHSALRIGDRLQRVSTIASVAEKSGRAGAMVFVTVSHVLSREDGELLMQEDQDLVFMPIPETFSPPPPTPLPACDWSEAMAVDPVLLFRFSALTFNGHRIHYDRPYAVEVEHYPGLVVHGPLQAVLLMEAALRRLPERSPERFDFRGLRPLFDFDAVSVNGRAEGADRLALYTANGEGAVGMQATLDWRPA